MKKSLKSCEIMTEWWLMMWNLGKFLTLYSCPKSDVRSVKNRKRNKGKTLVGSITGRYFRKWACTHPVKSLLGEERDLTRGNWAKIRKLAHTNKSIGTFRVFFLLFASALFLGFTFNDYFDFSCRTRLKTVELERDRMSHEVTKVVIFWESRHIFFVGRINL